MHNSSISLHPHQFKLLSKCLLLTAFLSVLVNNKSINFIEKFIYLLLTRIQSRLYFILLIWIVCSSSETLCFPSIWFFLNTYIAVLFLMPTFIPVSSSFNSSMSRCIDLLYSFISSLADFNTSRSALYSVGFFLKNLAGLALISRNAILPLDSYLLVCFIK